MPDDSSAWRYDNEVVFLSRLGAYYPSRGYANRVLTSCQRIGRLWHSHSSGGKQRVRCKPPLAEGRRERGPGASSKHLQGLGPTNQACARSCRRLGRISSGLRAVAQRPGPGRTSCVHRRCRAPDSRRIRGGSSDGIWRLLGTVSKLASYISPQRWSGFEWVRRRASLAPLQRDKASLSGQSRAADVHRQGQRGICRGGWAGRGGMDAEVQGQESHTSLADGARCGQGIRKDACKRQHLGRPRLPACNQQSPVSCRTVLGRARTNSGEISRDASVGLLKLLYPQSLSYAGKLYRVGQAQTSLPTYRLTLASFSSTDTGLLLHPSSPAHCLALAHAPTCHVRPPPEGIISGGASHIREQQWTTTFGRLVGNRPCLFQWRNCHAEDHDSRSLSSISPHVDTV